jgi:HD-GYP domain-containing protein (c-di-GMP phosphodiesterase class II)
LVYRAPIDFLVIATGNRMTDAKDTTALKTTQDRLNALVDIGILLSAERDRDALIAHILMSGKRLSNCDAATLYLMTERKTLRFAVRSRDDVLPAEELPLHDPATGAPAENYVSTWAALHGETVNIADVYRETRFDLSGTRRFDEVTGYRTVSMVTIPMRRRNGDVVGVLQFMNAMDPDGGDIVPFARGVVDLLEAMASQAAVSLDVNELIDEQSALLDAIVRIIALAIDARSPYTGGHCRRVPELSVMLAEAASAETAGKLGDFRLDGEDAWREFRIGAWLHDCGKIAVPDHIIDKSTKLEMIYNRIHEVRTRFEVLWRDAEIRRLQALLGGADAEVAEREALAEKQALQEEFAFVAACNIGCDFMGVEKAARLREIGARTWLRHFDNRIGISEDERMRMADVPSPSLPATECLLADHPHVITPRDEAQMPDPKFGFKMSVPDHIANEGELYNLCVMRGTLTEEERFRINEHMIHTVITLEGLPFPKNMRRVPEYASTHHETLIGTGYPRRLSGEQLSVPARIVAIADIFEALTAADRPYKKPMPLSESIRILAGLRDQQHIDADLFDLFLSSGVYLKYAQHFLRPEQIDEVDVSLYLQSRGAMT